MNKAQDNADNYIKTLTADQAAVFKYKALIRAAYAAGYSKGRLDGLGEKLSIIQEVAVKPPLDDYMLELIRLNERYEPDSPLLRGRPE